MRIGTVARCSVALLLSLCAVPASAQPAADAAPAAILWPGAPARCVFLMPADAARYRDDDPSTARFLLLTMRADPAAEGEPPVERAYLSVGGLLRELEKVRAGPDGEGRDVTVWRSAGEPRINVNTTLWADAAADAGAAGRHAMRGTLTLQRAGGEETQEIAGTCGP